MADEKKKRSIFKAIIHWFKDTAEWVQENLGDPAIARALREDLGLKPGQDIPAGDKDKFKQFGAGLDPDKAAFDETVAAISNLVTEFKALAENLKSSDPNGRQNATDILYLIGTMALVDSLRLRVPLAYSIAKILVLISDDPDSAEMFDIDMLVKLIREGPDGFPPDIGQRILFQLVPSALLNILDYVLTGKASDPNYLDFYYGWDPAPGSPTPIADTVASRAGTLSLRLPPGNPAALALSMIHVPPEHGGHGLFLALNGTINFEYKEPNEATEFKLTSVLPGQLNLFVPFQKTARKADFSATAASTYLKMSFLHGDEQNPAIRLGEANKTRLDVARWLAEVELSTENALFRFGFKGAKLIIDLAGADEFIASVSGTQQVQTGLDFILVADAKTNTFRVEGGAKFKASIPGGNLFGGALTVHHIDVGLGPSQSSDREIGLEVSGAFAFNLGPFKGSIDRIGFMLDAGFKKPNPNLGFVDLALGFKPPNGIGFVIDASLVKGGGYLFVDAARGEYAGALELSFKGIGIKAIAVLSTRMPDGSKGWSLLLLIYSQFPPIQLSWGFTLNGIGGMIGIQHGLNIEELKTGMRTGALDDILFPKDPVADAPRIINRLRAVFPATPRTLVFGPMIELGWGTPSLISIRMGLLFQLDNVFGGDQPVAIKRIVLIGQLIVQLPPLVPKDAIILKLLVDFYGYYDFDLNRLEFAARLRDSHVIKLPLSGMLFIRAEFGEKPIFILSAGGFHPNFKDLPADMPSPIDRLEIKFDIDFVKIRAQKYFAITAATVQTGASLDLSAKFGPIELAGFLGYDAILYFQPRFFFEVDIRAGVKVKFKGHTLAGVDLKLHLEGPGRWRAKGSVSFSILWWDIEKGFDVSWGDDPAIVPVRTRVAQQMQQALSDEANWRAQLPHGGESLVTLALAEGATGVLAHPLGQLQVTQKIAPFGLTLQKFGNTQIDGPNKFDITALTIGGQTVANPESATEFFSRAQFVEMSDEQKLSSPSFERFTSGVSIGSGGYITTNKVVSSELTYETAYLQPDQPVLRSVKAGLVSLGVGKAEVFMQAQHGAAAKSALRRASALKPADKRKIVMGEAPLAVTNTDTHAGAVNLDGLAAISTALAEQQAGAVLGNTALGKTHAMVEAFELIK